MLFGLMRGLATVYYWTWPAWPFALVFSFAFGLAGIIKNEEAVGKNLLIASVSLLVILAGILYPAFG